MSLSTEDDLLVELLDELMIVVRAGQKAPLDEVCAHHPKLAAQLRDRLKLMEQIRQGQHPALKKLCPGIPRDLETIVRKAAMSDQFLRYKDAQTLADDLRLFLLDRPIRARRTRAVEHVLRWCRKNRALAAMMMALTTLVGILVIGRFVYVELAERHQNTLELLGRTESAEQEANGFAQLREVSRYRQTGLSGLADRLPQISLQTTRLSDAVRQELRNEWLSCMARADWSFTTFNFL